ncbi:hypothetical protein ACFLYT_00960 [Nanoarchaeota archaeon]
MAEVSNEELSLGKIVAETFLKQRQLREHILNERPQWMPLELRPHSGTYRWDDDKNLVEFPFVNTETSDESGYVIVSADRSLTPVIEYTTEGMPFSEVLQDQLRSALTRSSLDAEDTALYYWNGAGITAKVTLRGQTDPVFIEFPTMKTTPVPATTRITRDASKYWKDDDLREFWESIDKWNLETDPKELSELLGNITLPPAVTLNHRSAVRYQQACRSYPKGTACAIDPKGSGHYCAPREIAGCGPVAWAMLASAWKHTTYAGSDNIWRGSTDWNLDWFSFGGQQDPSRSQVVSDAIWEFHRLCGTDANGSTSYGDMLEGRKFFEQQGVSGDRWPWAQHGFSYDWTKITINSDQPFIFIAQGQWNKYLNEEILSQKADESERGSAGHAVIVNGYDSNQGNRIRVCLGWGMGFQDRVIDSNLFDDKDMIYLGRKSGLITIPIDCHNPKYFMDTTKKQSSQTPN